MNFGSMRNFNGYFTQMLRTHDQPAMQKAYDFARGYLHALYELDRVDHEIFTAGITTLENSRTRMLQSFARNSVGDAREHRW